MDVLRIIHLIFHSQKRIRMAVGLVINPGLCDGSFSYFSSFAFLATLRETGFFHAKPQSPQRNRKEESEEINLSFSNA